MRVGYYTYIRYKSILLITGCFLILDDSSIEYLRQDEWKRQSV